MLSGNVRDLHIHEPEPGEVTAVPLATILIDPSETARFGCVDVKPNGEVVGFEEKPKSNAKTIPSDPQHVYGSMGIYIFDRKVLEEELTEDAKKDTTHDFGSG